MYDHQPRIPPPASGTQNMRRGPYPLSLCTATPSTCGAHASHSQLTARDFSRDTARARRSRSSSSRIANRFLRRDAAAASRKPATVVYYYWLDGVVSVSSTGAADVRLYATPALPLIANWHIPLQNFPQVDIWAGLFYCVLPFFLLVTSS